MLPVFRPSRPAALLVAMFFSAMDSPAQAPTLTLQQHAQRANQYLQANQPAKAIPEFEALVAAQPENVDAQANLGVLLYFQRRHTEAEEHLKKAVQLNPSLAKIQALLGLCEYQLGHLTPARTDLSNALSNVHEPKLRKEVGLTLIEIDTAQQSLADAAVVAQKLRDEAPEDPEILYAAYRIHSDLAGESLLSLSLVAPRSGQMQQAIGHELERVRDLPGAIASFRKAVAANPDLPGIHFELAEALHSSDSQADRAQAEPEYALALEKNPGEVQAAVRLGDLHADRGDLEGATRFYNQALQLRPDSVDANIGLARVYSDQNENEKALPLMQRALAADPSNLLTHFRLSALYRRLHRPEDSKRELLEYQKLKTLKDNLRQVYSTMKIQPPGESAAQSRGDQPSADNDR